jgi:hypothetical protein
VLVMRPASAAEALKQSAVITRLERSVLGEERYSSANTYDTDAEIAGRELSTACYRI